MLTMTGVKQTDLLKSSYVMNVEHILNLNQNKMTPTPKEKAGELVDKYRTYIRAGDKYEYLDPEDEVHLAIKCALILVDEILDNFGLVSNGQTFYTEYRAFDYYSQVKQELIKSE